jgi:hypothetical protein
MEMMEISTSSGVRTGRHLVSGGSCSMNSFCSCECRMEMHTFPSWYTNIFGSSPPLFHCLDATFP